jgi:hypothetical protein
MADDTDNSNSESDEGHAAKTPRTVNSKAERPLTPHKGILLVIQPLAPMTLPQSPELTRKGPQLSKHELLTRAPCSKAYFNDITHLDVREAFISYPYEDNEHEFCIKQAKVLQKEHELLEAY